MIKKLLFAIMFSVFCINIMTAQKFMRYHMNDKSFNGFYTESIDSITYCVENGKIVSQTRIDDLVYNIVTEKVDSVIFEKSNIGRCETEGYRLYEINDANIPFNKIYSDNRSVMMASNAGTFAANDTILLASAFYRFEYLICTDEEGNIASVFDGEQLYFIHYNGKDEGSDVFNAAGESISLNLEQEESDVERGNKVRIFCSNVQRLLNAFEENNVEINGWSKIAKQSIAFFLNTIIRIQDNAELKDEILITDNCFEKDDEIGVTASLEEISGSPGDDAFILYIVTVKKKGEEAKKKLQEKNPKSKQAEAYKNYYGKKYGINLIALPPEIEEVQTNVTLKGELHTTEITKRGKTYFLLSPADESDKEKEIPAITENTEGKDDYILTATEKELKPDTEYTYFVIYKCKVNNLEFTYKSDKQTFKTGSPTCSTGECSNIGVETATVKCTYENVPQNATCGVALSSNYGTLNITTDNKDGERDINLPNLKPSTAYSYYAYIEYDGKTVKGDVKSFTTLTPACSTGEYVYIGVETATVRCIYENVPQSAVCGVALSSDYGMLNFTTDNRDGEHGINLSNLKPSTAYSYYAYIEYDGKTVKGDVKSFTTLTPACSTGECVNVTDKTATVRCTYENVPQSATCGIVLSSDEGTLNFATDYKDGEYDIRLPNLKPSTAYSYYAYIGYDGKTIKGNVQSFTTKPVDLSGTWTLNIDGEDKVRTLILTEGGGVIETEDVNESFNGGSWTVQKNECSIRKTVVFGGSVTTYVTCVLDGTFDSGNLNTITGVKYNENVNSVTGIPHQTEPIPFVMNR